MNNGNRKLAEIAAVAKRLDDTNNNLTALAEELTEKINDIKHAYIPAMRGMARRIAELKVKLIAEVDANPEMFEKPKSRVEGAVKFGFRKQNGKISWNVDDDVLVARIRKMHPENEAVLIIKKELPSKEGLTRLTGDEIKKLGVTITEDTDEAFVKFVEGDGQKLAGALIDLAEKVQAGKEGGK